MNNNKSTGNLSSFGLYPTREDIIHEQHKAEANKKQTINYYVKNGKTIKVKETIIWAK